MFGGETEEGGEPELVAADLAMYEAKEHGRDDLAHHRTSDDRRPRTAATLPVLGE